MLPASALKSMRVMIATPCYDNSAKANFLSSLSGLMAACQQIGIRAQFQTISDSLITRARNTLVAKFLSDPIHTHLFFIDGDVGFETDAFFRLLLADRQVGAGVYPLKEYNWPAEGLPQGMTRAQFEALYVAYPFTPLPSGALDVDRDGFAEVKEVTTGFMCIQREVFAQMAQAYPDLDFHPVNPLSGVEPGSSWLFFDTMRTEDSKLSLSEDFTFCRRWRAIGGKVYIDADSKLTHQGQHTWQGDLRAHLEARRR